MRPLASACVRLRPLESAGVRWSPLESVLSRTQVSIATAAWLPYLALAGEVRGTKYRPSLTRLQAVLKKESQIGMRRKAPSLLWEEILLLRLPRFVHRMLRPSRTRGKSGLSCQAFVGLTSMTWSLLMDNYQLWASVHQLARTLLGLSPIHECVKVAQPMHNARVSPFLSRPRPAPTSVRTWWKVEQDWKPADFRFFPFSW